MTTPKRKPETQEQKDERRRQFVIDFIEAAGSGRKAAKLCEHTDKNQMAVFEALDYFKEQTGKWPTTRQCRQGYAMLFDLLFCWEDDLETWIDNTVHDSIAAYTRERWPEAMEWVKKNAAGVYSINYISVGAELPNLFDFQSETDKTLYAIWVGGR